MGVRGRILELILILYRYLLDQLSVWIFTHVNLLSLSEKNSNKHHVVVYILYRQVCLFGHSRHRQVMHCMHVQRFFLSLASQYKKAKEAEKKSRKLLEIKIY